ncbi:hypothetical protein ACHAWF_001997 [Thalassiosira exigua]
MPRLELVVVLLSLISATAVGMATNYNLRRYRPSDLDGVKRLFADNLQEEWRDTYHGGKYAENAERFVESVVSSPESDLNNVEETYFGDTGGYFWVLTWLSGAEDDDVVVGTCGLQRLSSSTAEIRRMCMAREHRRNGWGTEMLRLAKDRARSVGVSKLVVSTIEHSVEGIDFYKTKNGFVDAMDERTGRAKRSEVHGTPICEVFMEFDIGSEKA